MSEIEVNQKSTGKLSEDVELVVKNTIQEVLEEFTKDSKKYFTADVLHALRTKITTLVHQRTGSSEVVNIDVGLDLTKVEDYDFFFRINIPKEKAEEQILA